MSMKDQQVQMWGMLSHDQAVSFHCNMHGQSRSPPCAMSACIGSTAVTVPSSSWSLCRTGALCLPGGSTASADPAKARSRLLLPDCAGPKTKHCTAHPSSKSHAARCRSSAVTRLPQCPWPESDLFLMARKKRSVNHECFYISKEHIMNPHQIVCLTWKTLRLALSGFFSWRRGALTEKRAEGSPLYPSSNICSRAAEGWIAALYTHCSRYACLLTP